MAPQSGDLHASWMSSRRRSSTARSFSALTRLQNAGNLARTSSELRELVAGFKL
jgi:hypothetical protein